MSKILIVAPHTDDEVLSAASFLEENLEDVTIFYHTEDHAAFDISVLRAESDALVAFLGCNKIVSNIDMNDLLDTVPVRDLVNEYEQLLYDVAPHTVVLPNPSYNQDHRAVYDAALTAMRPHDRIPFVKRVLVYEEPETFGTLRNCRPFMPQYFRKLDVDRKIKLNEFYQSQIRGHRSFDQLRSIAHVRGMQSGYEYAEAFEVLRWVS